MMQVRMRMAAMEQEIPAMAAEPRITGTSGAGAGGVVSECAVPVVEARRDTEFVCTTCNRSLYPCIVSGL